MQWKEALFIKNKEGKINNEIYEALLRLPDIRDKVFFPDYKKYGYIGCEPKFGEFETTSINFYLTSIRANRWITLSYIFMNNNFELGIINDNVRILNAGKGWTSNIWMSLLMENRKYALENKRYSIPEIYPGTPEQKLEACLRQIKLNYDYIAPDIISGENWDNDAWNIGGNF